AEQSEASQLEIRFAQEILRRWAQDDTLCSCHLLTEANDEVFTHGSDTRGDFGSPGVGANFQTDANGTARCVQQAGPGKGFIWRRKKRRQDYLVHISGR